MQVWKYPLEISQYQTFLLPEGAEILTVQIQDNTPQLWALLDPKLKQEERHIGVFGTGHNTPGGKYIGTFQMLEGILVYHVFELS